MRGERRYWSRLSSGTEKGVLGAAFAAALLLAPTWALAATYYCQDAAYPGASCAILDQGDTANRIVFTCKSGPDAKEEKKTCKGVFAAVPAFTFTGLLARDWDCEGTIYKTADLNDTTTLCGKLCGFCAGGWK